MHSEHELKDVQSVVLKRTTVTDRVGYKEVELSYRIARSKPLEASGLGERSGRITCPFMDACRSTRVYGAYALPDTEKASLEAWAKVIGIDTLSVKVIAYLSGNLKSITGNFIHGRFCDTEINTGLVHQFKYRVNTGILADGVFSQDGFNQFAWHLFPILKGINLDQAFMYSSDSDNLFVREADIPSLVKYNCTHGGLNSLLKSIGRSMSRFEMTRLLLDLLAQKVNLNSERPKFKESVISLRDIFDLYKYGWFPAVVEEKLADAGWIDIASTVISSTVTEPVEAL